MEGCGMIPDSTQDKRRRKKDRGETSLYKKKKGTYKDFTSGRSKRPVPDGQVPLQDVSKTCAGIQPIASYIQDRGTMVLHMFQAVNEQTLNSLVPDVLKAVPRDELCHLCTVQLELMSERRILNILHGVDPTERASSSLSDIDDSGREGSSPGNGRQVKQESQTPVADSTSGSVFCEEQLSPLSNIVSSKVKVLTGIVHDGIPDSDGVNETECVEGAPSPETVTAMQPADASPSVISRSNPEMLELEMRARAIKAMLNKIAPHLLHSLSDESGHAAASSSLPPAEHHSAAASTLRLDRDGRGVVNTSRPVVPSFRKSSRRTARGDD